MKRRNVDCKLRRPLKRNKITDGIYGSTLLYLKFFVLWAIVLVADFLLEFRFELLWPFWLLLRSVYDSFKYQGLAFSVFFICIALTSDMLCFFFIPVQWLFFAASTYVWVQFVWHTDKGICLPTLVLWLLFVYMEAAVRLRDLRHLPFHLDLCRPFAAHCIGYPVVTLGFGFKSYVGYRMRQRKQKDVARENEFYMQLLQEALPLSLQQSKQSPPQSVDCHTVSLEKGKVESVSNGVAQSTALSSSAPTSTKNNHRKSMDKGEKEKENREKERERERDKASHNHDMSAEIKCPSNKYSHTNGSIHHGDIEIIERLGSVNDFNENEVENDKSVKGSVTNKGHSGKCSNQVRDNTANSQRRNKANRESSDMATNNSTRDEYCQRLEADVKRLKIDLQASRQTEQDLRSQINTLIFGEKSVKSELLHLQQDNDDLQTKLHGLVTARQADKQAMTQLERRLAEERRLRTNAENQLASERKAKKMEEAASTRAIAMAAAASAAAAAKQGECTESCRSRRRDLEAEAKQLRREIKQKEERLLAAEREVMSLRQYKESHAEAEVLMSALAAMQDKNAHLENSLSAETRIKLDLFSALGEVKRQLELREALIQKQEHEIEELQGKFAEVLAVMPAEKLSFMNIRLPEPRRSKLRFTDSTNCTQSTLDPNAMAYTPKNIGASTSTEA